MRIGIDCRTMLNPDGGERAGIGHYTFYLVRQLVQQYKKDTFVLFFDHHTPATAVEEFAVQPHVEIMWLPMSTYKKYLPIVYSHGVVAQALKRAKVDVFHSPAYVIPLAYTQPTVVTIHDLAIYRHPEWFPTGQAFAKKITVPSSVRKASAVIAVSQATARMVQQLFSLPQSRVRVIYEGFTKGERMSAEARRRVKETHRINDRFIFFVGTIEPRKNLQRLVQAFDRFMDANYERHSDVQLVIAGGKGWKHQQIFRTIARAKWSGNIRVVGYISHAEKIALLESCLFFAFPSLWEGFGLPVLEAASMGVPVLTSQGSSLPEVAGPGALYVYPQSIQSIQHGIETLVRSVKKRESLGQKGKKHAEAFSWKRCAKETHDVYVDVVQQMR